MREDFDEGVWDGSKCPLCGKDCWKNRINLAIEIAKNLNREFSMKELYEELAKRHPPARKTEKRKTPWATFFRDLYENPNFVKVDRGVFKLVESPQISWTTKNKTNHNEVIKFENEVKKLQILRNANLISEEDYMRKGRELLESIKAGNGGKDQNQEAKQVDKTNETEDATKCGETNEDNETTQIREEFINSLKKYYRLPVEPIKGRCLYEINGLIVNIKVQKADNSWFNVSENRLLGLKTKKTDYFIWVYGDANNFTVIPNERMHKLTRNASVDKKSHSGTRYFNIKMDGDGAYFIGKGTKIKINEYYRNLKPLLET